VCEAERDRVEGQLQLEKIALERANAEKEARALEVEAARTSSQHGSNGADGLGLHGETGASLFARLGVKGPRMPPFEDEKDDLDSYLFRFAEVQGGQ
jgi:hypothetical protein